MKTRSNVVSALSLVVIVFGFSAQASAGAGQPPNAPPASCQIDRPSGTPVSGTVQVLMDAPDGSGVATFHVQMVLSFRGNEFSFIATIPGVQVVNGGTLDAICAMLGGAGTVNDVLNTTLNDAIVQALGTGNTVKLTSTSVLGTVCQNQSSPQCQTVNSPRGLDFTSFNTGSITATGTVTLYLQP